MPKTRSDLIRRALEKVNAVGAGQPVSAEDSETVNALLDPVVLELNRVGDVGVIDLDEVDEEVFLPLSEVVAYEIASDFGAPRDEAKRQMAIMRLRQVTRGQFGYGILGSDYF